MRPEELLTPTPSGVCCQTGGFHIDPTRPVDKAVITHGHSDHARPGHGSVLTTQETLDLMRLRYGDSCWLTHAAVLPTLYFDRYLAGVVNLKSWVFLSLAPTVIEAVCVPSLSCHAVIS